MAERTLIPRHKMVEMLKADEGCVIYCVHYFSCLLFAAGEEIWSRKCLRNGADNLTGIPCILHVLVRLLNLIPRQHQVEVDLEVL